jgi:hypothetical protein
LNIKTWTPEEVEQEAWLVAVAHDLDPELFRAVVSCESSFVKDAVGDAGMSHGAVQIHLPSHPTVTKEQAHDPEFALNWMAERWQEGSEWMWSCYQIVKSKTPPK